MNDSLGLFSETYSLSDKVHYVITVPADLWEWASRTGRMPFFDQAVSSGEFAARCALDELHADYGGAMIRQALDMGIRAGWFGEDDIGRVGVGESDHAGAFDRLVQEVNGRSGRFGLGPVDRQPDVPERLRAARERAVEPPPRPVDLDPSRLPALYGLRSVGLDELGGGLPADA